MRNGSEHGARPQGRGAGAATRGRRGTAGEKARAGCDETSGGDSEENCLEDIREDNSAETSRENCEGNPDQRHSGSEAETRRAAACESHGSVDDAFRSAHRRHTATINDDYAASPAQTTTAAPSATTSTTDTTISTTNLAPTDTSVTAAPDSAATATSVPSGKQNGNMNLILAVVLILVGIGVLVVLFRASD